MNFLLRYILPATLVAGFLCSFINEALHVRFIADDCFFDAITHSMGLKGSISYCYQIANGRWFSHIISSLVLFGAGHNCTVYTLYIFAFLTFFLVCTAVLLKNFYRVFAHKDLSWPKALITGLIFTSILYFLLYPGRREVWFWLSSASNHLLSVSLGLLLFGLLISGKETFLKGGLIFFVAALVGGLNEVNAICNSLLIFGLMFFLPKYCPQAITRRGNYWLAIIGIGLSLGVNFISGGYQTRMQVLPDFNLLQAFKNTMHSILQPILQKDMIPIMIIILLGLGYLLQRQLRKNKMTATQLRRELIVFVSMVLLIGSSFFLHSYTLSDVISARGSIWGYTVFLFVIFTRVL